MRKSMALAGTFMMAVAVSIYILRRFCTEGRREPFENGSFVGMEIDRRTDPALSAALQKAMDGTQWLACVPLIQLEKMARAQIATGAKTLRSSDISSVVLAKKIEAQANVKRLPYSPEFKAGLNKYVDYSMTSIRDILAQFSNADGFVDLERVAKALSDTRGGYCKLGTNFGSGGSFLVGVA
jgi:hypothetical protein